jgi:predicted dehydrogenase
VAAVKAAVVGIGHAGRHHARAWAAQPGFALAAVCDLVEEKARAEAERYGCRWYGSLEAMLSDQPDIGVLSVATRETDRNLLVDLLAAGKHLFVEKPLVALNGQYDVTDADLAFADRLMGAWEAAGTVFGINFNYRTFAHMRRLKGLLESGVLGEPVGVSAWANLNCWSHAIDLLRWYLGDLAAVAAVEAHGASLRFVSGVTGTLWGTLRTGWQHPLLRIELFGTKGRAVLSDLLGDIEVYRDDPPERERWQAVRDNRWSLYDQSFTDSVAGFALALRGGRPAPVSALDGYRELQIDAGFWISARAGRPYEIDLTPRGPGRGKTG